MDLDKLLADYKGAYLSYPQVRRDVEFKLMAALVDEVKVLKAASTMPRVTDLPAETVIALQEAGPGRVVEVDPVTRMPAKRGPGRPPKAEAA